VRYLLRVSTQSYSTEIAGHVVTVRLSGTRGQRILTLDDIELREGKNGRFVGGSYPRENRLLNVVRGELSGEEYVKGLRRRAALEHAARALSGERVERAWGALTDGAPVVH